MMTAIVILLWILLFMASPLAWAIFFRLGLHWIKLEGVTWLGVLGVSLLVTCIHWAIYLLVVIVAETSPQLGIIMLPLAIVAGVAPVLIIKQMYQLTVGRAFLAWLPTWLTPVLIVPLTLFVVIPFVFESFVISGNSMAPTLLGPHWETTCVECGGPAYGRILDKDYPQFEKNRVICRDHFHVTHPAPFEGEDLGHDRIIVTKFIHPKRWDLIVFRSPENPEATYIMRLVGLPGETITIEEGQVHANGESINPPERLQGIRYAVQMEGAHGELAGTPDVPAKLGPDEYFVLGDFSIHAKDSRMWQWGAEGHNRYAVPESHLIGVVTHTYWPVNRWRAFR